MPRETAASLKRMALARGTDLQGLVELAVNEWLTPCCGVIVPASKLRKVDLPLPDGPISRRRSPVFKEKPSMESVKAFRPGQVNRTSAILTIGAA